jgi:hypothetical protein
MPEIKSPPQSFSSDDWAQALGEDPKRVCAGVALMRSGDTDLLEQVLSGRLSVEQALKTIKGRVAKAQI